MLPGCRERHCKGGEGTLLCITSVLDVPSVTQDGGLLFLAGPWEVVRQSQSYSHSLQQTFAIPLASKWRDDLVTCCHVPKSPLILWTPPRHLSFQKTGLTSTQLCQWAPMSNDHAPALCTRTTCHNVFFSWVIITFESTLCYFMSVLCFHRLQNGQFQKQC